MNGWMNDLTSASNISQVFVGIFVYISWKVGRMDGMAWLVV